MKRIIKFLLPFLIPAFALAQQNPVYLSGSTVDNTVIARNSFFVNGTFALGKLDTTGSVVGLPLWSIRVRPQDTLAYYYNGKVVGPKWTLIGNVSGGGSVISVNGQTGVVTIFVPTNTNQLANGANYITAAGAPVQSVNGNTGAVVVNGSETKVQGDGTYVTVSGSGTILSPYVATWIGPNLYNGQLNADSIRHKFVDVSALADGYTLQYQASTSRWVAIPFPSGASVPSVFGRTGAIVAVAGDYTFAQIGSLPTTIAGYGITDGVTLTGVQTLTNKTLNAAQLNSPLLNTTSTLNWGWVATNTAGAGAWTRVLLPADTLVFVATKTDLLTPFALPATRIAFGGVSNLVSSDPNFVYKNTTLMFSPGFNTGTYSGGFIMNGGAFQQSGSGTINGNLVIHGNITAAGTSSLTDNVVIGNSSSVNGSGSSSVTGNLVTGTSNNITNGSFNFAGGTGNFAQGANRSFMWGQDNQIRPQGTSTSGLAAIGRQLYVKGYDQQVWVGGYNDTTYPGITSIRFGVGTGPGFAQNGFTVDSLNNAYLKPGTTAGRTPFPLAGSFRINSDSGYRFETYNGSNWNSAITNSSFTFPIPRGQIAWGGVTGLLQSTSAFKFNTFGVFNIGGTNTYGISGGFDSAKFIGVLGNGNTFPATNNWINSFVLGTSNTYAATANLNNPSNNIVGSNNTMGLAGNLNQERYSTIIGFGNKIENGTGNTIIGVANQLNTSITGGNGPQGSTLIGNFLRARAPDGQAVAWFGQNNDTTRPYVMFGFGQGASTSANSNLFDIDSVGNYFLRPGTTSQRATGSVRAGTWRINADSNYRFEVYTGTVWGPVSTSSTGGGVASIPPNRGSAFRLYSPQIPAFNSLSVSGNSYLKADSTSATGEIRLQSDTGANKLATQTMLNSNVAVFTGSDITLVTTVVGGLTVDSLYAGNHLLRDAHHSGSNLYNHYWDSTKMFFTGPNYKAPLLPLDTTTWKMFVINPTTGETRAMPWQVAGGSSTLTRINITSGTSSTMSSSNAVVNFNFASVAPTYNLTLPASPADQDKVKIQTGITIAAPGVEITSFTITANSGQTLNFYQPVSGVPLYSGAGISLSYNANNSAWERER